MIRGFLFWFFGYNVAFQTPYSLDVCRQILLDQSSNSDSDNPFISKWLGMGNHAMVVDVYPKTDSIYTFRLEKSLRSGRYRFHVAIVGQLENTPHGTLVMTNTRIPITAWLFLSAWMVIIFGALAGLIIHTMTHFELVDDTLPIIGIVWLIFLGLIAIVQNIYRFGHYPEKWLMKEAQSHPSALIASEKEDYVREFNFYSADSLEICMRKLSPPSQETHYQATALGMVHGTSTLDGAFIGFIDTTPTQAYFVMERNNPLGLNRLFIQTIGKLQSEGEGTRIIGFSQNKSEEKPILGWLWLTLMIAIAIYNWVLALFSHIILSLISMQWIRININQSVRYFSESILGRKGAIHNKQDWRWLTYHFDSFSPYPIEDCHNMLFAYSAHNIKKQTVWGYVKGKIVKQWLFVTVRDESPTSKSILIQSVDMNPFVICYGTLQTEGYGTRVTGYSTSPLAKTWGLGIPLITASLVIGFLFFYSEFTSFASCLFWVIPLWIIISVSSYYWLKIRIGLAADYIEGTLENQGQRKGKSAETPESE